MKHILFPAYSGSETLRSDGEYLKAMDFFRSVDLPHHPDPPKNWDSLAALSILIKSGRVDEESQILDAGGEFYSVVLKHLSKLGIKQLYALNLAFENTTLEDGIQYIYGDITKSPFPDNFFNAVTCLSVLEHGVDPESFFKEMNRVIQKSGILIISTDYWKDPIDTNGRMAYGVPIHIFNAAQIKNLIFTAEKHGFKLIDDIDYECDQKVISWETFDFTFIYFTLIKVSD